MSTKTVKLIMAMAMLMCSFNLVSPVWAQEESKNSAKADKKKTKIDFEDELVEGELKKPELFYLLQKKQFNFKRLIRLRENFLPEMRRDADEIRRGRGKN